jgi:hypothetical protein
MSGCELDADFRATQHEDLVSRGKRVAYSRRGCSIMCLPGRPCPADCHKSRVQSQPMESAHERLPAVSMLSALQCSRARHTGDCCLTSILLVLLGVQPAADTR